jgi:nitrite reductase/ring-hydroxylating ferredoxin subunit/uncharacterized membrane protein
MKSKAHIKGHPLHPMLIAFPVAFFTGTFLLDLWALLGQNGSVWQIGKYLEIFGIATGLAAAIPGLIDFTYTVPPNSSGQSRAIKHAMFNSSMLMLFVIAAFTRNTDISFWIVAIEAVAFVLLSIAGWMGGTLVYRNQIGVDPRYAQAGKWKEASLVQSEQPLEAALLDELQINQMKLLRVGSRRIVLARSEKGYFAFDDRCSHRGGSLAGGAMICGTVQCPWHGSQFDIHSGAVKAGPAQDNIATYGIQERDGKVFISTS